MLVPCAVLVHLQTKSLIECIQLDTLIDNEYSRSYDRIP